MKHVGIIGGGVVGLCSAWYLQREGFQVTVLDRAFGEGCSYGNAGMIVPSHIIPLASPGMISKGIRWMFNPRSPFYIKLKADRGLLKWGYQFMRHATERHVNKSIPYLRDISLLSKEHYRLLARELPFDFGYQERGLLMLFNSQETEREEFHAASISNKNGVEARVITQSEIQRMEPRAGVTARGGVFYPGDAQMIPHAFMTGMMAELKGRGVELRSTRVTGLKIRNGMIESVIGSDGKHSFDEVVFASGVWSGELAAMAGIALPMQGGKGYSFTVPFQSPPITIPTILLEQRVAITPMGNTIRFGGTMEMSGINSTVSMKRVEGIAKSIPKYYSNVQVTMPERDSVWLGLRPCSPDGLPFIGRSRRIKNLILATGHAMMGMSLGPATGVLVTEMVKGEKRSVAIDLFDPERYS